MYMSGVSVSTLFTNERHLQEKHLVLYLPFWRLQRLMTQLLCAIGIPPKILELIKLLYGDTR